MAPKIRKVARLIATKAEQAYSKINDAEVEHSIRSAQRQRQRAEQRASRPVR